MSFYLLIDAEYLTRRAWHTTGGLSHRGTGTGVAYGVIREAASLISFYQPDGTAWCFDSRRNKRKEIYPKYKSNRMTTNDRVAMLEEVKALRTDILPALGFRNVFAKPGYEADDLIAALAENIHFADQALIVGSDKDLYQCLGNNIKMYNPASKKTMTVTKFKKEYGIHPSSWARVKAIAGCNTDCVEGIAGVGEKTAALWVRGKLKGKKAALIDANLDIITRNIPLVSLPFDGCKCPEWSKDKLTRKRWRRVCRRLGIKTVSFPG